jgi:quercetin dioxygenase-like cupin family protein
MGTGQLPAHNGRFAFREAKPTRFTMTRFSKAVVFGIALLAFAGAIVAQNPGLTRTIVVKADVSVPGREAVVARVEVAPGGVAGWHTHPGDEISYVAEGEATLMIAGQPPRKVAAGEGFVIPAGVVHNARNDSMSAVRLVGVYVVEKGKPLASPASAPAQ